MSGRRIAGVIGRPIAHSLSPTIHRHWLSALGLDHDFVALSPRVGCTFDGAVRAARDLGFSGLNVTAPFKADAIAGADEAHSSAKLVGAANLLTFREDGRITASNTDVAGFVRALTGVVEPGDLRSGVSVVLGAGGAARAAVQGLLRMEAGPIRIWNRTFEKAQTLADAFASSGSVRAATGGLEDLTDDASLVVDATSGLDPERMGDVNWTLARRNAVFFDLKYGPQAEIFRVLAERCGRRFHDGLGMLIAQARPSFEAFFGVEPPDDIAELEAKIRRRSTS